MSYQIIFPIDKMNGVYYYYRDIQYLYHNYQQVLDILIY